MSRGLLYTDDALADLDAIKDWLTQPGSGATARRKLSAIRAAIRRLRDHPCLFAPGAHKGVREMPCVGGYRVLYRLNPDSGHNNTAGRVHVLRIFGPGQSREHL